MKRILILILFACSTAAAQITSGEDAAAVDIHAQVPSVEVTRREPFVKRALWHVGGAAKSSARYANRYKFPLFVDTLEVLSGAAVAESTFYAEKKCPYCVDAGFWPHPTHAQAWGEAMVGPALGIFMNHAAYHHYRADGNDPSRVGQVFFPLFIGIPVLVHGYADTIDNVNAIVIQPPKANGGINENQHRNFLLPAFSGLSLGGANPLR